MSAVTQCPECDTCFKVSQAQLAAHQGIVRCGHCQATFNALHNLYQEEPSPQIPLPIDIEDTEIPKGIIEAQNAPEKEGNFSSNTFSGNTLSSGKPLASPLTLTRQFSVLKSVGQDSSKRRTRQAWLWTVGAILLSIVLLAQASYFFRVEIAARLPGLKPMLTRYCVWLRCSIPLPQKAELISIESSSLEASPTQVNVIALSVTLRNRAPYNQGFPNLELTFTDPSDSTIARKVFPPETYLTSNADLRQSADTRQGLLPNRELNIKLHLDSTDLRPTGYRLFLFYP